MLPRGFADLVNVAVGDGELAADKSILPQRPTDIVNVACRQSDIVNAAPCVESPWLISGSGGVAGVGRKVAMSGEYMFFVFWFLRAIGTLGYQARILLLQTLSRLGLRKIYCPRRPKNNGIKIGRDR